MTTAFAELPWIVDPDALKSFLAVLCAVAHPLTNEKTRSLAEREGEHVSPPLARTRVQASVPGGKGVASGCETRPLVDEEQSGEHTAPGRQHLGVHPSWVTWVKFISLSELQRGL